MVNPRVFLEFHIGVEPAGRLTIELFPTHAPKACENFLLLCRGTLPPVALPSGKGIKPTYANTCIHRIVPGFMIQGGDITAGNGTGGLCVLPPTPSPSSPPLPETTDPATARTFEDENLGWQEIDKPGLVCMANRGPNTNTSQFFVTLDECQFLTEKHTVFGEVVGGLETLVKIAQVPVDEKDRPCVDVVVSLCGEVEFRGARKEGGGDGVAGSVQEKGRGREEQRRRSRQQHNRRQDDDVNDTNNQDTPGTQPTDAEEAETPRRGRSRTPVPTDPRSPRSVRSPEERRPHHHRHHRSRSPRRRHRHYHDYRRRDDPDAEERIRGQEREREGRRWDTVPPPAPPPTEPEVKFKGRGAMRYRERKRWGGGGAGGEGYGRLN